MTSPRGVVIETQTNPVRVVEYDPRAGGRRDAATIEDGRLNVDAYLLMKKGIRHSENATQTVEWTDPSSAALMRREIDDLENALTHREKDLAGEKKTAVDAKADAARLGYELATLRASYDAVRSDARVGKGGFNVTSTSEVSDGMCHGTGPPFENSTRDELSSKTMSGN